MNINEDNWSYHFDIIEEENVNLANFEDKVNLCINRVVKLYQSCFPIANVSCHGSIKQNNDVDLKSLIEKNKTLSEEIDVISEELQRYQIQYENFKEDRKLLSEEIKDTHEAFLMAKKYYKKYLKMYHTIESSSDIQQTIFVQFFTETKKESEKYSVRLSRDVKTAQFEIIDMNPKLAAYKEIKKKLQETNDIAGAICCIRQLFLKFRNK